MFRSLLIAGLATAAFVPTLAPAVASAQSRCLEERHDNRVVGTIIGAGLGALLGNAIGEHGGKPGGAIIGGLGGAVAGNAIGASTANCGSNQYGYYDDNGRWVPKVATAYGYYDAGGRWVDASQQAYAPPPPPPGAPGPGETAAMDTREREAALEDRIQARLADGRLDQGRGRDALRQVGDIRRMDQDYRAYDGHLTPDQRADILVRLDGVRARLGLEESGGERAEGGPPPPPPRPY